MIWAAHREYVEPVKCPECGKAFSAARLGFHLWAKHHIGPVR
jgi:hypothetical protein